TAKLLDATTGQELATLKGRADEIYGMTFSPDSTRLVTGSRNRKENDEALEGDHVIKLWDAITGKEVAALNGHNGNIIPWIFSPDGKRLVTESDNFTGHSLIRMWNAATGDEMISIRGCSAAFSPDSKILAMSDDKRSIRLWDAITGNELLTLKGDTSHVCTRSVSMI